MKGIGKFGGHFQDLWQCLMRKSVVEGFVDVIERHAIRKTFQNQRNGKPRTANSRFPA